MSKDNGQVRKPEKGKIPIPRSVEHRGREELGIEAYSPHGDVKLFVSSLISTTFDLNVEDDRQKAANIIARIKTQFGVDSTVGPSYSRDHNGNNPELRNDGRMGIYIDAEDERILGVKYLKQGLILERQYTAEDLVKYNDILPKVLDLLPNPIPQSK